MDSRATGGPTPPAPETGSAIPADSVRRRALRPRDAATLVVFDRTGPRPAILMGRRNPGLAFMPGQFVFPGGRVEPDDRRMVSTGALPAREEAALASRMVRPSAIRSRALALAAIRETFEETGLLVGTSVESMPPGPAAGVWKPFFDRRVLPDLSRLAFVGRAITPPGRPRRFDARFFAVERSAVAATVEGVVGPDRELVELAWVDLGEAAAFDLPRITRAMLDQVAAWLAAERTGDERVPFHFVRRGTAVVEHL